MKAAKLLVKQNPDKPVAVEILAESIVAIAQGVRNLVAGPLNERALHLLIQNAAPSSGGRRGYSPIAIKDIKAVFAGIAALEATYLKKATRS